MRLALLVLLPSLAFAQTEPCFDAHEALEVSPFDERTDGAFVSLSWRAISLTEAAAEDLAALADEQLAALATLGFDPPPGADNWLLVLAVEDLPGTGTGGFAGTHGCAGDVLPYVVLDVDTVLSDALEPVLAQELFHTVQQAYAFDELWTGESSNLWIREATAGLIEGLVAPDDARRQAQARRWMSQPQRSLTTHDASGVQYGTFVFFEHLARRHGYGWHLEFWEAIRGLQGWDALVVLDQLMADRGSSLAEEWRTFLIGVSLGEVAQIDVTIPADAPGDFPALVTRDDLPWFTSDLVGPAWPEPWGIGAVGAFADEAGPLFGGFEAEAPYVFIIDGEETTGFNRSRWGDEPETVWFLASPLEPDDTFSLSLSTGCACSSAGPAPLPLLALLPLLGRRRYSPRSIRQGDRP